MKNSNCLIFAALLSLSTVSSAWKDVGNAAGVSEQNLIYAMDNAEGLLHRAGSLLDSESDKVTYQEFLKELKNSQLEFNYDQNTERAFAVRGHTWILYSANLLKYDQDGNEVLSLKESYQLLLEIFAFQNGSEGRDDFKRFEEKLLQIFAASEKTWILKTYGEELQWTEFADSYYLFYADLKPLHLTQDLLQARLCAGNMTQLKLHNPAMTSVQKSENEVRLLVVVDAYYQCDGQPLAKRLPLDLSARKEKEAQLKLR